MPNQAAEVALFIDWENLRCSPKAESTKPNLKSIVDYVRTQGRIVLAHAYADWSDAGLATEMEDLYYAGVTPVYVPAKNGANSKVHRNDSVDIKLSVDAVETSYERPEITRFVIVSGDADFIHVVRSLRRRGKGVSMIGGKNNTSSHLGCLVDDLVRYEDLAPTPPKPTAPAPPKPAVPPSPKVKDSKPLIDKIVGYVREQQSAGKQPTLSSIGLFLRGEYPDFTPKEYGFSQLQKLLKEKAADRLAIQRSGGTDTVTLLKKQSVPTG